MLMSVSLVQEREQQTAKRELVLDSKRRRTPKSVQTTSRLLTVLRSEEHTSELQSLTNLVCRLLLEKKKKTSDFGTEDGGTGGRLLAWAWGQVMVIKSSDSAWRIVDLFRHSQAVSRQLDIAVVMLAA